MDKKLFIENLDQLYKSWSNQEITTEEYFTEYDNLTKKINKGAKNMIKKVILVDFDGVIHKAGRWEGVDKITGKLVPGMKELIKELRENYEIHIYSTRCQDIEGRNAIRKWLKANDIEVDGITKEKLQYMYILIDDRAINFNGDPKKLKNDIENFEPWTRIKYRII